MGEITISAAPQKFRPYLSMGDMFGGEAGKENNKKVDSDYEAKRAVDYAGLDYSSNNKLPGELCQYLQAMQFQIDCSDKRTVRGAEIRFVPGISQGPYSLHPDLEIKGPVLFGILSADQSVQGIRLFNGTRTLFYADGQLLGADFFNIDKASQKPPVVTTVDGYKCSKGFTLYPGGKVHTTMLAEDKVIGGKTIKALSTIKLDRQGRLSMARVMIQHNFDGINYGSPRPGVGPTNVAFFPSGRVKWGEMTVPRSFEGANCGQDVEFYESGRLKCCWPDEKFPSAMIKRNEKGKPDASVECTPWPWVFIE